MMRMQLWQWIVVGAVALLCVGYMSFAVVRMFGRRAEAPATLRLATAFESANVGAEVPPGAQAFDGFSYRVPGRFAGRVRIMVRDDRVSIAGPRIPAGLYGFWIWLQVVPLALVPAAFVAAAVKLDWRWLLAGVGLFALNMVISSVGAGIWPGFGETDYIDAGRFKAVEFGRAQVHEVKIGEGWADGGIDVVVVPVKKGIDGLARNRAVSFYAPDDDGRKVRYAFHMTNEADATRLAELLR